MLLIAAWVAVPGPLAAQPEVPGWLRDVLKEPDAPLNIAITDGIAFDTGFALKEFAKLAGIELKPGDINQEE